MEEAIGIYAQDIFPVDFHRFFEGSIQQSHIFRRKRPRYWSRGLLNGKMVVCPQDSGGP